MEQLNQVKLKPYLIEFFKLHESKKRSVEVGFIKILYPSNTKLSIESFAFLRAPPEWLIATEVRVHPL